MFVKENTALEVFRYAVKSLLAVYPEEEAGSIISLVFNDLLHISGIQLRTGNLRLSESDMLKVHYAVKRLEKGEPVQYVLGSSWFWGMKMTVTPDVLIPRPETEEMIQLIQRKTIKPPLVVADICCGSGCIALSLKSIFPSAKVTGVDISESALTIASGNAKQQNLMVDFIQCDITASLPVQNVDLLVCNPPYVPLNEAAQLHRNVRDYEPALALFVPDNDVYSVVRPVLKLAFTKMSGGGKIWIEFHRDYVDGLAEMMQETGYRNVEVIKDLQQNKRFATCTK